MGVIISAAMKKFVAARTLLLLDEPFWGTLALKLQLVEDPSCDTAWVNGRELGFNPAFVMGLPMPELIGVIAHEVEHCARGHPWRRDNRDFAQWNEATDRTINPDLRDCGFSLPDGVLYEFDPSHKGKSSEWVFDRLPPRKKSNKKGKGKSGSEDGSGSGENGDGEEDAKTPNPLGEVRDAPTPSAKGKDGSDNDQDYPTEADWKQAVYQAAVAAKQAGKGSARIDRLVADVLKSKTDWKSYLWKWAQQVAREDSTWARPNRRHLPRGMYLPSLRSVEMGPIAVFTDTSASVDRVLLRKFGGEFQALADQLQPSRVYSGYCDANVANIEVFEKGEPVQFRPVGGGGTDFRPAFKEIEKFEEKPACMVYLTDLDGRFPTEAPDYPVLWITGRDEGITPPFGEVVVAED